MKIHRIEVTLIYYQQKDRSKILPANDISNLVTIKY